MGLKPSAVVLSAKLIAYGGLDPLIASRLSGLSSGRTAPYLALMIKREPKPTRQSNAPDCDRARRSLVLVVRAIARAAARTWAVEKGGIEDGKSDLTRHRRGATIVPSDEDEQAND